MKKVMMGALAWLVVANSLAEGREWQWKQEPTSLLGIQLGAPLSASMAECPRTKRGYAATREAGKMCWQTGNAQVFAVKNHPDLGLGIYDVRAEVVAGMVERVAFRFKSKEAMSMAKLLQAKYGEPFTTALPPADKMTVNTVGSKGWYGKYLTLTFDEKVGESDEGEVCLYSKKYTQSREYNVDKHKNQL